MTTQTKLRIHNITSKADMQVWCWFWI